MHVVIAGGHGQIAQHLERLLTGAAHAVRALIRDPAQAADIEDCGAEAVVCDLEALDEAGVARVVGRADAFVFAAGAGPGSGPERKWTLDHQGAVKTIAACRAHGIDRYVIVSSMGADDPSATDDGGFGTYLLAKRAADDALRDSGLAWTIVRPGGLTNDPPTGRVTAAPSTGRGEIPRADVAAALAVVLAAPGTAGATFELIGGDTPLVEAIAALPDP